MGAIQPLLGVMESKSWPSVPCVIESSEVSTHRGSDSTTYRVDIRFAYSFEGVEYSGGSYNFSDVRSSGYDSKKAIVEQYPVGLETDCWVNPADPNIAVLSRDVPTVVYFLIPFTGVFMLVGGGIMLGSAGLLPTGWIPSKRAWVAQEAPITCEGSQVLKPEKSGLAKVVGAFLVAGFWNGITGVFVWQIVDSFQKGRPEWFLTLFMIPFVVIGIGLILFVIHSLCALRNPKFTLTLNTSAPRLGQRVAINWRISGAIHRLKNLAMTLEGMEAATYRRGTRSVTDTSVFCRQILFESSTPAREATGDVVFVIPADTMHSFTAENNEIKWRITVRGEIAWWPDVNEAYPLTIHPHPATEKRTGR